MSSRIFWSERAKNDYKGILRYLIQNWSAKEVVKFTDRIERNIRHISANPEIGTISKKKSVRRLVVSRQTSMYYQIIHGDIYIITIFDNRQNPDKLKLI